MLNIFRAEIKRYFLIQWSSPGDSLSWFLYTFLGVHCRNSDINRHQWRALRIEGPTAGIGGLADLGSCQRLYE